jgi:glyoxylase-like metal-dependent hydrolase (beta-lactamase superfamily II)
MIKRITAQVYQLSGVFGAGVLGANVYLLAGEKLTLVDAGFKGRATHILRAARKLGYSPSDIDEIIITHHHADHVGSLARLKEITGARIVAHPADAPYIDGRLPQPAPYVPPWLKSTLSSFLNLWSTAPSAVDMEVEDGDEFPILGGIKVLHMPGHTHGSICLYLSRERLVIAGDVLSNTFGLSLPSKEYTVDLTQEIRSIQLLSGLDFDILCFGHGTPLIGGARSAVVGFLKILRDKNGSVPDDRDVSS